MSPISPASLLTPAAEARGGELWDAPNLESRSLAPTRALLLQRAPDAGAHAAPSPVRLRLRAHPPLCGAFAWLSAGVFQWVLGWERKGVVEREVRVSAFSPHSSGGVQSSGWDMLVAAAAAAAAKAPEPCTPPPGTQRMAGGEKRPR